MPIIRRVEKTIEDPLRRQRVAAGHPYDRIDAVVIAIVLLLPRGAFVLVGARGGRVERVETARSRSQRMGDDHRAASSSGAALMTAMAPPPPGGGQGGPVEHHDGAFDTDFSDTSNGRAKIGHPRLPLRQRWRMPAASNQPAR